MHLSDIVTSVTQFWARKTPKTACPPRLARAYHRTEWLSPTYLSSMAGSR